LLLIEAKKSMRLSKQPSIEEVAIINPTTKEETLIIQDQRDETMIITVLQDQTIAEEKTHQVGLSQTDTGI
jgi:hypothetical protein